MNGHVFDELPQLLTGEADRATVASVAAHLRECDDCRDELIAAVTAHAALASAVRFAPEVVAPERFDLAHAAQSASETPSVAAPIDLSALFAQVRSEVADESAPTVHEGAFPSGSRRHSVRRRDPNRTRRTWLSVAAAVVLLGAGGATFLAVDGSSGPPARNLALSAFDQGSTSATAKLIGDNQMKLDASSLPALAAGNYYEVWLTNDARTAMAPVGVLDASRKASITVPATEMGTYDAIEVSVQQTASVGAYSGHSVLRGNYA